MSEIGCQQSIAKVNRKRNRHRGHSKKKDLWVKSSIRLQKQRKSAIPANIALGLVSDTASAERYIFLFDNAGGKASALEG